MVNGQRMRELRVKQRLNQQQLAANCGVTQAMISMIESGECEGTLSTLKAIATTLGCSLDELVGEGD